MTHLNQIFLGTAGYQVMFDCSEKCGFGPRRMPAPLMLHADYAYTQLPNGFWKFIKFRYDVLPDFQFMTLDALHEFMLQYLPYTRKNELHTVREINKGFAYIDAIAGLHKARDAQSAYIQRLWQVK